MASLFQQIGSNTQNFYMTNTQSVSKSLESEKMPVEKPQPTQKDNYFNNKTILGSITGLGILGVCIWRMKSGKAPDKKNTPSLPQVTKPSAEKIQAEITVLNEKITNLKNLIKSDYIAKRKNIIDNLNQFDEYSYNFPFSNRNDLNKTIENLEKDYNETLPKSNKIIKDNRDAIRNTLSELSQNPEWKELKLARKNLIKVLEDENKTDDEILIANNKISFINDLLVNRAHPDLLASYKEISAIDDAQALELVRKNFKVYNRFTQKLESMKDKDAKLRLDKSDKYFNHTGKLSLSDIFHDEMQSIKVRTKTLKTKLSKLNAAKSLRDKLDIENGQLVKDYRNTESVKQLQSLVKELKTLKKSLEDAA